MNKEEWCYENLKKIYTQEWKNLIDDIKYKKYKQENIKEKWTKLKAITNLKKSSNIVDL